MSIPIPPSDNLYKFVSIAGLLLMLASLVLMAMMELSESERMSAVQLQVDHLRQTGAEVERAGREHSEAVDALGKAADDLKKGNSVSDAWVQLLSDRAEDRNRNVTEKLEKMETLLTESGASIDAWKDRRKSLDRSFYSLAGLFVVSMIVTYVGFNLWYERVQKFEDQILIARAAVAHRQLDEVRSQNAAAPSQPEPTPADSGRG